jgi:hypothetical protein
MVQAINVTIGAREIVDIQVAERETQLQAAIQAAKEHFEKCQKANVDAQKAFEASILDAAKVEYGPRIDDLVKAWNGMGCLGELAMAIHTTWNSTTPDIYTVRLEPKTQNCHVYNRTADRPLSETNKGLLKSWKDRSAELEAAALHLNKCRQMLANLPSEERKIRAALATAQLQKAGAEHLLDAIKKTELPAIPALPMGSGPGTAMAVVKGVAYTLAGDGRWRLAATSQSSSGDK